MGRVWATLAVWKVWERGVVPERAQKEAERAAKEAALQRVAELEAELARRR